jgi:hypothetical protein
MGASCANGDRWREPTGGVPAQVTDVALVNGGLSGWDSSSARSALREGCTGAQVVEHGMTNGG